MIDAHTHFNLDTDDPALEYIEYIQHAGIEAAVLILNGPEESHLFWNNVDSFLNGYPVHLAFILDIRNREYFERNIALAKELGMAYSVKLHPRLTDITENDFEAICGYIKNLDCRSVIIDSFLYGSRKENICYIELSSFLAKRLPDKQIVMAHFGGIKVLETMLRTRELKNIFYDCSFSVNFLYGTSAWADLRHCIVHSQNRVVFGSDRPSFTIEESVRRVRELLGERSDTFYSDLFSNNARRLYFD